MNKSPLKILVVVLLFISLFLYGILYRQFYQGFNADSVTVFILDTQLNQNNQTGHGQLVKQIIAGKAPGVEIISLEVSDRQGNISEILYLQALQEILNYRSTYPDRQIVVNISLGFSDGKSQKLLINNLLKQNILIVAAAGNHNSDIPVYPAGFSGVVAVASAGNSGKSEQSNFGDYIDLSAPGDTVSTRILFHLGQATLQSYRHSGTSFAAPRVVGAVASLLMLDTKLESGEALQIINETATEIKSPLYQQNNLGSGLINRKAAIKQIKPSYNYLLFLQFLSLFLLSVIVFYNLWEKYAFYTIFIFLLGAPVLLPLIIIFSDSLPFLLPGFLSGEYRIYYLFLYFIIFILTYIITGWSKDIILLFFVFYPFLFYFIFSLYPGREIFLLLPLLVLFIMEKSLVFYINKSKKEINLFAFLNSSSRKIRAAAGRRFIESPQDKIKKMLIQAAGNKHFEELLIKQLVTRSDINLKDLLVEFMSRQQAAIRYLASKIIRNMEKEQAINLIEDLMEERDVDRYVLIEAMSSFNDYNKKVDNFLFKIINQSQDMWLRYQALRTLILIKNESEELLPLLVKLKQDTQQLVSLEATYYFEKISGEAKK